MKITSQTIDCGYNAKKQPLKRWIYDYENDKGETTHNCTFIGTKEDFDEKRKISEELWGSHIHNIREQRIKF